MVRGVAKRRRRHAVRPGLITLARFFDDNLQALLFIGFVFLLGVLVGLGVPRAAGAAELDLEPLDIPSVRPVSEVLFVAISQRPYGSACAPEMDALWLRLAKAELRLLQLEERLAWIEAKQRHQSKGDTPHGKSALGN